MKKILILIVASILFLSFTDGNFLKQGDSILKNGIQITGVANHAYSFCFRDAEKFQVGFVDKRILNLSIRLMPQFDDVYHFGGYEEGCLIWVEKNGMWGVLDIDDYEMKTDFIYEKFSSFKEKSVDKKKMKATYEADALLNGDTVKVLIEKFCCISYYDY